MLDREKKRLCEGNESTYQCGCSKCGIMPTSLGLWHFVLRCHKYSSNLLEFILHYGKNILIYFWTTVSKLSLSSTNAVSCSMSYSGGCYETGTRPITSFCEVVLRLSRHVHTDIFQGRWGNYFHAMNLNWV